MKQKKSTLRGSLILFLAALIWGVAFVAQSVGMRYVGGFTFNSVRFLIGALVLLPAIRISDRKKEARAGLSGEKKDGSRPSGQKEDRPVLIKAGLQCGSFLFVASNLQQFGIKYTSVGKSGFITACYIILVPILGLFIGKKCGKLVWAAVLLTLSGLYLLCMPSDDFGIGKGDVLLLFSSLMFAFQILSVDHFSRSVSALKLSAAQFLFCGIFSGIPALLLEAPSLSRIYDARVPILYAGILSCGVAYTCQVIGQRETDNPTVSSLIMSLESCVSVIAGWLLLSQRLSTREIAGCMIMFIAIILAQLPDAPRRRMLPLAQREKT